MQYRIGYTFVCFLFLEQWQDELKTERARKIMKRLDRMVTDESKRQSTKFNEEYLGMPGSFRTLSVD